MGTCGGLRRPGQEKKWKRVGEKSPAVLSSVTSWEELGRRRERHRQGTSHAKIKNRSLEKKRSNTTESCQKPKAPFELSREGKESQTVAGAPTTAATRAKTPP